MHEKNGNSSDRQGDLLRPLAREFDPRERALLEETLAAVLELRDLLCGTIYQAVRPGIPGPREEWHAW